MEVTAKIDKALADYLARKKDIAIADAINAAIAKAAADIAEKAGVKPGGGCGGSHNHG